MRVLLASASQRRLIWLNEHFESIELICMPLLSDEKIIEKNKSVEQQSIEICFSKVESAALEWSINDSENRESPDIIIVSDTLVESPGDEKIALGKPEDSFMATSMLLRLSGKRHRVWSSTAFLVRDNDEYEKISSKWSYKIWTDYAIVEFDDLNEEDIIGLVESDSWIGKAGGYDFAGHAGKHTKIIEGDVVTVLGFSKKAINELEKKLDKNYAAKF
jgi:predicted house-cleaning NTP pyrophosphatase (Maf/HAM1 superfamily)|tara:strand:+ start:401 stop:1054 length:654 start_codon:yes stop_codon:yes gene_type:complete